MADINIGKDDFESYKKRILSRLKSLGVKIESVVEGDGFCKIEFSCKEEQLKTIEENKW